MKVTAVLALFALLATSSLASPVVVDHDADATTHGAVKNAVLKWHSDTGHVSNFLDNARSLNHKGLKAEHKGADSALIHEKDELTHKAVLDKHFCTGGHCNNELNAASHTLVQEGTFQSVVNLLADMKKKTAHGSGALQDLDKINHGHDGIGGRCQAVLPAIDLYFEHAAKFLTKKFNDKSLNGLKAVRPKAC